MALRAVLVLGGLLAFAGPAQADEYLKSKAPKSHIDSFLTECRYKVPDASCRCMVRELAATPQGDFLLDLGGPILRLEPGQKLNSDALLKALNRHGLKASEGKAITDQSKTILRAAANSCG